MKKKITAIVLCIAMLAIAIAGGTMAYFTDTDAATNTFTVGNLNIHQNEQERKEIKTTQDDGNTVVTYSDELQDFTQNQVIMPAVYPNGQSKEDVVVNGYTIKMRDESVQNYVDKIISVTNDGTYGAYVRTIVAVPYIAAADPGSESQADEWLHTNAVTDADTTPHNGWYAGTKESGEWPAANLRNTFKAEIDGKLYEIRIYTNVNVLAGGKSTAPCFAGFYLDDDVDCEYDETFKSYNYFIMRNGVKVSLGDISNLKIYAATQAVQAEGFSDAWTALDEAFGDVKTYTEDELKELFGIGA